MGLGSSREDGRRKSGGGIGGDCRVVRWEKGPAGGRGACH